jgi:hypothetical protein
MYLINKSSALSASRINLILNALPCVDLNNWVGASSTLNDSLNVMLAPAPVALTQKPCVCESIPSVMVPSLDNVL